ncbi:MAG TPA: APC family permease [Solirubrobacteraceae bacterium]|nr:APC family permease [Solirubrobacteraceae bacterium]
MSTASVAGSGVPPQTSGVMDKGLKKNAIGYLSNLVIGVASTAPAYSLAATLGVIVAVNGVGARAPAVLIVSFIPMLFIASAYKFLNRADPDAGTTFAWTTRALGPSLGWINGWAIFLADVLVMASLAEIAGKYTFLLVGWQSAADSNTAQLIAAVIWIMLMTWICYRGIELSARIQQILLSAEVAILGVFSVVALIKVYGNHPAGSIEPSLSWFNPFDLGFSALVDGVLLGMFIYWGWDSGVAVNEESEDSAEGPGRAAVMSTILLVLIYVLVSTAGQAYGGTSLLSDNSDDVLSVLGKNVFGSPWDKLLIISVLTSASASTQTTILPTARTTLSMAYWKAVPEAFGRVHKRFLTPSFSTLLMGGVSITWTVLLLLVSPAQNALGDSITAIGFPICFYYGFTGIACVVYYRRELGKRMRNLVLVGLVPLIGGLVLFGIFGKAFHDYSQAGANYSKPILGIELPIIMGVGGLLLGVILMLVSRPFFREYFSRKTEVAQPGILDVPVEHAPAHF